MMLRCGQAYVICSEALASGRRFCAGRDLARHVYCWPKNPNLPPVLNRDPARGWLLMAMAFGAFILGGLLIVGLLAFLATDLLPQVFDIDEDDGDLSETTQGTSVAETFRAEEVSYEP